MLLAHWPTGKRIAASAAFCLCVAVLIITAFQGLSDQFLVRGAQTVAIAVAAIGILGLGFSVFKIFLDVYSDTVVV